MPGCSKLKVKDCKITPGCSWATGKGCRRAAAPDVVDASHHQQHRDAHMVPLDPVQEKKTRGKRGPNPCKKLQMGVCKSQPECIWVTRKGCEMKPGEPSEQSANVAPVQVHEEPVSLDCKTYIERYLKDIGGIQGAFDVHLAPDAHIKSKMKPLGSGEYGLVLSTAHLQACYDLYSRMQDLSNFGTWKHHVTAGKVQLPNAEWKNRSGLAAIKVQVVMDKLSMRSAIIEDLIHAKLSRDPITAGLVPRMYAGFSVCTALPQGNALPALCAAALPGLVFRVTLMEQLSCFVTLNAFASRKPDRQARYDVYVALRKLFLCLWSVGQVAHCDVHSRNIMVNPRTREVKLLDFGMSMRLKPETVSKCKATLRDVEGQKYSEARHAYRECEDSIKAEAAVVFRDYEWYNLDTHMLRAARLWVHDGDFKLLPAELHPATLPVPAWANMNAITQRNAPTVDVFFNK